MLFFSNVIYICDNSQCIMLFFFLSLILLFLLYFLHIHSPCWMFYHQYSRYRYNFTKLSQLTKSMLLPRKSFSQGGNTAGTPSFPGLPSSLPPRTSCHYRSVATTTPSDRRWRRRRRRRWTQIGNEKCKKQRRTNLIRRRSHAAEQSRLMQITEAAAQIPAPIRGINTPCTAPPVKLQNSGNNSLTHGD